MKKKKRKKYSRQLLERNVALYDIRTSKGSISYKRINEL